MPHDAMIGDFTRTILMLSCGMPLHPPRVVRCFPERDLLR